MPARVHVIVSTHTTRWLRECLLALAGQERPADVVSIGIDGDDPAIVEEARAMCRGARPARQGVVAAWRAHAGVARLNQVRNNALRALEGHVEGGDHVVVIDGDIALAPDALARHARLAADGARLVHAGRVNLDRDVSRRVADALRSGAGPGRVLLEVACDARARADLASRAARARRHAFLRWIGLEWHAHKPKVLGAHHGVSVDALRRVNGYDEWFEGYGFDDDDLARRLHRSGHRGVIAIEEIVALHLWHESRATPSALDAPGAARFRRRDLRVRCEHGWSSPRAQAPVRVEWLIGG